MPAYKFFKRKYGEDEFDLRERKNEIVGLINEGKGNWIITFCLAVMPQENKLKFAEYIANEMNRDFAGDIPFQAGKYLKLLIAGDDTTQELKNLLKSVNAEIATLPTETPLEKGKCELYKGVRHLVRCVDEDMQQRLSVSVRHLVEAYVCKEWADDEFAQVINIRNEKYRHYALYAMTLTEIWPLD